jgi:hypothetical protein
MKKIIISTLVMFFITSQVILADVEKVWTRQYLNDNGIDNSRISYYNQMIYLDGNKFYGIKPIKGKTFANKEEFAIAVEEYLNGGRVITIENDDGTILKSSSISFEQTECN